ncbi:MAG: hypothetical protein J3K34DRAFT_512321 [Monoraphidium minutum]|nr:MAG: hypothetical protein J3K34DRAFT_512321 [Monoraphidium minutum]
MPAQSPGAAPSMPPRTLGGWHALSLLNPAAPAPSRPARRQPLASDASSGARPCHPVARRPHRRRASMVASFSAKGDADSISRARSLPGSPQQPPAVSRRELGAAAAADSDCVAAPQPLRRVQRPALKRRSSGPLARGLSRAYHGRSQSFACIQDLLRNPWAGDSALALAKRGPAAAPVPVPAPGGAAAALPRAHSQPARGPPLRWSIDEESECLLGGVGCSARLAAPPAGGATAAVYATARYAGGDDDDDEFGCCSSDEDDDCGAGSAAGCGATVWPASSLLSGGPWAAPAPPAAAAAPPSVDGGSSDGDASGCSLLDEELTAALRGARLSPQPACPGDLWLGAAALMAAAPARA